MVKKHSSAEPSIASNALDNRASAIASISYSNELNYLVADLVTESSKLDSVLDLLEKYQGVIMLPSYVNIRYAFRHIVEAINKEGDLEQSKKRVELAKSDIVKARMDAIEAFISLAHYKFLLIEKRYRSADIFKVCPEYYSIKPHIDEINEFITSPHDLKETDIDRYENLRTDYLPRLTKVYDLLNQAEQHALIEMKKDGTIVARLNIMNVLGFLIGVAGLVLAAVSFR